MQLSKPKTIHLKDYKPSPFGIERINLDIDIFDDHSLVKSIMKIQKKNRGAAHLELDGVNMELISIKLNGEILGSNQFQLSPEKLTILNIEHEEFLLEIVNKIDPVANKSCEGFYMSGEQLCTQCEPEGFRKITYFFDRPDVMAKFSTRMSADKKRFPFLLSNGNRISQGELKDGRHYVEWMDPYPKPCYLFAMVAGDFDVARDSFTTKSGRNIALEIYVDKGNLRKTPHAMESLKTAMKWDEDNFGLEYDLDIYMIVAVDSFNMGAMENKGLNIFNSTYTLADEKTATDLDFQNIQGVIGHEYFHNWTGNRVTCRDWFQLTLKEGLTVYRDQEFSADMLSRAVKRLEDVRLLKEAQFAEDAGPLSHPIRPESYIEINNFYTRTVYEKGAEVIRMIETLIGKDVFRKGMDKYFELYDGKAITTEDFVKAMELASGRDLTQFKNWYSRPGTPTIKVTPEFSDAEVKLHIEQKYPTTSHRISEENVLHLPFKIGFLHPDGTIQENKLELTKIQETFSFPLKGKSNITLNRSFSAPVIVEFPYEFSDLLEIMSYERDAYCRYEATQKIYDFILKSEFNQYKISGELSTELNDDFKSSMERLLNDEQIDLSFKSYLLDLPTENALAQEMMQPDFDAIKAVHDNLQRKIGKAFLPWFLNEHQKLSDNYPFELNPKGYGIRALKNQCLNYLVASEDKQGWQCLEKHYNDASNMTEEIAGLIQYIASGVEFNHPAIRSFYKKWKDDSLVMIKWFSALAAYSPKKEALSRLMELESDPLFAKEVPNYLRALYVQFAKSNLVSFHDQSGAGYRFMAERIAKVDRFNPQVASRGASAFSLINRLDSQRQQLMKDALQGLMSNKLSADTYEVVSKYLAQ
jgi:aminopeptidase N